MVGIVSVSVYGGMLVSKWVWLFQVGVIFRFLAFAEAEPTENELNIHSKVAAILVKAPEILASLQAYKGAGELIREVRRYSDVLCGCGFKWFWGVVSFSCLLMPSFHLLSPFPHAFFPLPLLTPSHTLPSLPPRRYPMPAVQNIKTPRGKQCVPSSHS